MTRGFKFQATIFPAAVIVAGFASVFILSSIVERSRPPLPLDFADSDLNMNGSRLKGFAFGMEGLIADWYFMRALQYIGDKMLSRKDEDINIEDLRDLNPRLLYPLLNNATDLDPHFMAAFSYGAMILPAIDTQQAVNIAEKGIKHNPDYWRLYQHLGYIYWRSGQLDKAAAIYDKGAAIEGATPFMKMMAAAMVTRGGSRETARAIYREMLAASDDFYVRLAATRNLQNLASLDEREAADKALTEFKDKSSRCANNLHEILPLLKAVRLPENAPFHVDNANNLVDPSGVPYLLDQDECKIKLDHAKTSIAVQ